MLHRIRPDGLEPVARPTFAEAKLRERDDLQRLLRDRIELVAPDVLVIAEEYCGWEDSRRRIDLLGVARDGSLVVIELKRTTDGGHMELQALRYAAMVSAMTWRQATDAFEAYLAARGRNAQEAEALLLAFLGWAEPDELAFAQDVRIVLVSADFNTEITTAVLWLNSRGLDIRCVRLALYALGTELLVDFQPIIPLPEAADYVVRRREKERDEAKVREGGRDLRKIDLVLGAETRPGLSKRHAIYEAVRYLCACGVAPAAIAHVLAWRTAGRPVFRTAAGTLGSRDFTRAVRAAEPDRVFDPDRHFTSTDELLHAGGLTLAVSNQWGADTWRALDDLVAAFPETGLGYAPAS